MCKVELVNFDDYLLQLAITFHLVLLKNPKAITFTGTCVQVVTRKQFIQAFVNFYIWWRDLIEGIGLCNLKQGLCKQGDNVHYWSCKLWFLQQKVMVFEGLKIDELQ